MAAGGEVHQSPPDRPRPRPTARFSAVYCRSKRWLNPDSGKDAGLANVPHRLDGRRPDAYRAVFSQRKGLPAWAQARAPCESVDEGRSTTASVSPLPAISPREPATAGAVACGQGVPRRFVRVENGRQPGRGVRGNELRVHPSDESRTDERYIQHGNRNACRRRWMRWWTCRDGTRRRPGRIRTSNVSRDGRRDSGARV